MTTRRVEFLRAWEDGTWDTVIAEMAAPYSGYEGLIRWAEQVLGSEVRHRKVVVWAVMNENVTDVPEREEEP